MRRVRCCVFFAGWGGRDNSLLSLSPYNHESIFCVKGCFGGHFTYLESCTTMSFVTGVFCLPESFQGSHGQYIVLSQLYGGATLRSTGHTSPENMTWGISVARKLIYFHSWGVSAHLCVSSVWVCVLIALRLYLGVDFLGHTACLTFWEIDSQPSTFHSPVIPCEEPDPAPEQLPAVWQGRTDVWRSSDLHFPMDPSVVDCTFSLELSCRQVGGRGLVIITKQNVSIKLEPVKITAKEN